MSKARPFVSLFLVCAIFLAPSARAFPGPTEGCPMTCMHVAIDDAVCWDISMGGFSMGDDMTEDCYAACFCVSIFDCWFLVCECFGTRCFWV